jgi:hypothetical protein
MAGPNPVALVVAYDSKLREIVGDWLEVEGFQVTQCPGPGGPDYQCVGTEQGRCPLAEEATVVVLDLWLETDADHTGAPSTDLLAYYRSAGRPIVALDHGRVGIKVLHDQNVALLEWPPDRGQLIAAVGLLMSSAPHRRPPR